MENENGKKLELSPTQVEGLDVVSLSDWFACREEEGEDICEEVEDGEEGRDSEGIGRGVWVEEPQQQGVHENASAKNAEATTVTCASMTEVDSQQQDFCDMSTNPLNSNDEQLMPSHVEEEANEYRRPCQQPTLLTPVVSTGCSHAGATTAIATTSTDLMHYSTAAAANSSYAVTASSSSSWSFPLLPGVIYYHLDPSGWHAWMHSLMHQFKVLQSQREKVCTWWEPISGAPCAWTDPPTSTTEAEPRPLRPLQELAFELQELLRCQPGSSGNPPAAAASSLPLDKEKAQNDENLISFSSHPENEPVNNAPVPSTSFKLPQIVIDHVEKDEEEQCSSSSSSSLLESGLFPVDSQNYQENALQREQGSHLVEEESNKQKGKDYYCEDNGKMQKLFDEKQDKKD